METYRQEYGRTGGNISYTLGLLETPCVLVASAGHDFSPYKCHLTKIRKVDLSGINIVKDEVTARGFVTTDKDDNQIWGFYTGAMLNSSKLTLKPYMDKYSLLIIAPNDPHAMMNYVNEAIDLEVPYVFDPAFNITHFTTSDLRKAVKGSHILIGNDYEVTLIQRKLKLSKTSLLRNTHLLVTTLGSKGSRIESRGELIRIPAARPENESDPTGAGDAFRAGLLAGYARGLPLEVCGRMGSVAAAYTVERYGTQTHRFNVKEFSERYKVNFNEKLPGL